MAGINREAENVRTIWKYVIPPDPGEFHLEMPGVPTFLDIQMQNGDPCLWAIVDPSAPMKTHRFRSFDTGGAIPIHIVTSLEFIATFQAGVYVQHVFRVV